MDALHVVRYSQTVKYALLTTQDAPAVFQVMERTVPIYANYARHFTPTALFATHMIPAAPNAWPVPTST